MLSFKKVTYYSDYPIKDTVERIRPSVWNLMNPDSSAPLIGTINNHRLRLYKSNFHNSLWSQNSFRPVFYGKLSDEKGVALIEGHYSFHRAVTLFLILGAIMLIATAFSRSDWTIPLFGLPFIVAFTAFGKFISRGEIDFIEGHIKKAIRKK